MTNFVPDPVSAADPPPRPTPADLPAGWPHAALHTRVREALRAIPAYFQTETVIGGVSVTDLHTFNTALGATIEEQVVTALNKIRKVWDPDGAYAAYAFYRQPQTFPDVRLQQSTQGADPILGIELKGWFLLAKEGEPSYRFKVTPAACAPADLLVVVPWVLTQVISGRPIVYSPFMVSAKHAAELRNWHWQHDMDGVGNRAITPPAGVTPYPTKRARISDVPAEDRGRNFGRIARTGLLDEYKNEVTDHLLCGIRIEHWIGFFKVFDESGIDARIRTAITSLKARIQAEIVARQEQPEARAVSDIVDVLATAFPEPPAPAPRRGRGRRPGPQ